MLNSLEDIYLTYSSIMKDLVDDFEIDRMMLKAIEDIQHNEEIIKFTINMKRKKKLFIAEIIFNWTKETKHFRGFYNRRQYHDFYECFEYAFSREVVNECNYKYHSSKLTFKTSYKNDKYNVVLYREPLFQLTGFHPYDIVGRAVVKIRNNKRELKICYLEYQGFSLLNKDIDFRAEFIKEVVRLAESLDLKGFKIACNSKYKPIIREALKRKYLKEDMINNIYK